MSSLNTYLDPVVQGFLESINISFNNPSTGNPNDVTLLSAMAYLPATDPFDLTAIQSAMSKVTSTADANRAGSGGPPPNDSTGVNADARDAAVKQILGALGNVAQPSDDQVVQAFYLAARDAFLTLLVARIRNATGQEGVTADTTIDSQVNPTYSLLTLMDKLKLDVASKLPFLNPDGTLMTNVTDFNRTATALVRADLGTILTDADQRAFVFDLPTDDALLQFGLGPWLCLSFMQSFNLSPDATFFTQVYARYAMTQAASVAIRKLAKTYDATSTPPDVRIAHLEAVATALDGVINTATFDYTPEMLSIMQSSAQTKTNSKLLGTSNAQLAARLSRTKDLQVSFQVEDKEVRALRRTLYAWLVALVAVTVGSAFLIATGRLSAYLMLAAVTMAIVVLYVIARLLSSWLSGGLHSSG